MPIITPNEILGVGGGSSPLADINPQHASVRLVFVKESTVETRWHICDVSLWTRIKGQMFYAALHGALMRAALVVNTIEQLDREKAAGDQMCEHCLAELETVKDIVNDRQMLKFYDAAHTSLLPSQE